VIWGQRTCHAKEQEAVPDASELNIGAACCNTSNSCGPNRYPACGPDLVGCGRSAVSPELGVKHGWLRADSYRFCAGIGDYPYRFN